MMWWPWSDYPLIVMVWCDMMWMIHKVTIAESMEFGLIQLLMALSRTFDARFSLVAAVSKHQKGWCFRFLSPGPRHRITAPESHSWPTSNHRMLHCRSSFASGLSMNLRTVASYGPMSFHVFPQCFQGSCPLDDGKWDGRPGDLSHHSQHPLCLAGTTGNPTTAVHGVLSWVLTWSAAASNGSPAARESRGVQMASLRRPNISNTVLSENKT